MFRERKQDTHLQTDYTQAGAKIFLGETSISEGYNREKNSKENI